MSYSFKEQLYTHVHHCTACIEYDIHHPITTVLHMALVIRASFYVLSAFWLTRLGVKPYIRLLRSRTLRGLCLLHASGAKRRTNRSGRHLDATDLSRPTKPLSDVCAYWRHLTNMIERSVRGGDAAFSRITLTTRLLYLLLYCANVNSWVAKCPSIVSHSQCATKLCLKL